MCLRDALLLSVLFLVAPVGLRAQDTPGAIAGRVVDDSGDPVAAADIRLFSGEDLVRVGATADDGTYRFDRVPAGLYDLVVSRIGYRPSTSTVSVTATGVTTVAVVLEAEAFVLPGFRVDADRTRERRRFDEVAGATVREMDVDELKLVPGVAEADPLRAIEVLPGVVSTSDFSSSFHVRGGSADQNLILLDGFPIFSPFHLGGFFGVFNADMLDRVELSSGGFGAEHGGRVSSVLAIQTDPGDGSFQVDGGVSLLAARAAVGGGLGEELQESLGLISGRWRASLRRSYFDVLLKPVFDFPYHLTDLQGTFEGWTRGGDQITLTAYSGRDVLDLTRQTNEDFPLLIDWDWGNDVVGVRWVDPGAAGGGVAVSAGYSRFGSGLRFPDFGDTDFRSEIEQGLVGVDVDLRPRDGWRSSFGGDLERFGYDNLASSGGTVFNQGRGDGWLTAAYAQTEWRSRSGGWLLEVGARVDGWHPDPGDPVWVVSPRVSAKRFFSEGHWAVKAALGRYTQFLHSLRDEELPIGLDIWILAGERAPHVQSDQVQIGVEALLGDAEEWQLAVEAYHRTFDGVVTFNNADDPNEPHDDILAGHGTSYGVDLLVRRRSGPVEGWLALSWLRARRTFPDQLSPLTPRPDVTFAPVFDRRLDADLVLRFPLGEWNAGLRWNVGTGVPFTRPEASFASLRADFVRFGGRFVWTGGPGESDPFDGLAVALGDRNGSRYPTYHRLDVSVRRTFEKSWATLVPHLDVLNLYNRSNVLFYVFQFDEEPPTRSGLSMFPLLPTVGLEIRF